MRRRNCRGPKPTRRRQRRFSAGPFPGAPRRIQKRLQPASIAPRTSFARLSPINRHSPARNSRLPDTFKKQPGIGLLRAHLLAGRDKINIRGRSQPFQLFVLNVGGHVRSHSQGSAGGIKRLHCLQKPRLGLAKQAARPSNNGTDSKAWGNNGFPMSSSITCIRINRLCIAAVSAPDRSSASFLPFLNVSRNSPSVMPNCSSAYAQSAAMPGLIPGSEAVHGIVNVKYNRLNHGSSVYIATWSISRLADMITSFPSFT